MGTSAWCGHYSQVSEISTHSGQHQHYRVWTLCIQHGVFKFNKQWHSFLLGSNWSEMINSKQRTVLQALLHVSGHKDLQMAFTISHESPHWNNYLCIFGQKKKGYTEIVFNKRRHFNSSLTFCEQRKLRKCKGKQGNYKILHKTC